MKNFLIRTAVVTLLTLFAIVCIGSAQNKVTVAYQNLPNVFLAPQSFPGGIVLAGSMSGGVTLNPSSSINNYTLLPPGSGGQTGYYICVGTIAGTLTPLAHCPGSGMGAPLVSATPSNLDYGQVAVGRPLTAYVFITNTGNATLTFTGSAFTFMGDSDFAVSTIVASTCANSMSLDGGASCKLALDFTPAMTGSRSATLSINDNAAGSPQTVALSGTGI